jgi:hypothetical protein
MNSVIVGDYLTDWFELEIGLRQGCVLSPLLFLIFIDGLARELIKVGGGVVLAGQMLSALLFADDIALVACSSEALQRLLEVAFAYSRKWRFTFNISKSNVVILQEDLDRSLVVSSIWVLISSRWWTPTNTSVLNCVLISAGRTLRVVF